MKPTDALFLLLLSAIWGASFLFMRVSSPEFGPIALVAVRMIGAVLVVLPFLLNASFRQRVWQSKGPLTVLGFFNHVIPFTLLSFATLRLDAGFTSLINATTPMFAAIVGALWFATPINRQQSFGLLIAFLGVFILSADKLTFKDSGPGWAILAGLVATFCYGISVNYSKRNLSHLSASEITVGSMFASSVMLLIPGLVFWPEQSPSSTAWISALLLAAVCTALAFLLFFRVLASAGAIASSTVTFLVPVFCHWLGRQPTGREYFYSADSRYDRYLDRYSNHPTNTTVSAGCSSIGIILKAF